MDSKRLRIVDEIQRALNDIAPTMIFEVYSLDNAPLIVLRDSDDECDAMSFEALSHSLELEIVIINVGYEQNSLLIAKVLKAINELKSQNFVKKELLSISRETNRDGNPSIALGSKLMYSATIRVKIGYITGLWEF